MPIDGEVAFDLVDCPLDAPEPGRQRDVLRARGLTYDFRVDT